MKEILKVSYEPCKYGKTTTYTYKKLKKGTCYIYAYAQNGVYKKIKVKVK